MAVKAGNKAPAFTLENQDGEKMKLSDFAGKWLVLYFYPKDNTSGCTTEAIDFTKALKKFDKMDAAVVGVSPDSVKSHQNFCHKHNLGITLLADPDKKALEKYGVWKEKSMYGKKYMGVERTTVLIDPDSRVREIWPKVKVAGHVDAVADKLAELRKG
ncbi:thioredoxin-dependent thiol peroxidase [candidate division GN15 bacterium]|nr:thioredoxin-dependent thiol peroxidase [candidate division GN15 bacterium]